MKKSVSNIAIILLCICVQVVAADRLLIGITSVFVATPHDTVGKVSTNMSYVNAVLESGGLPVVLPPVRSESAIDQYVGELDGLVLVGGMDVPPSAYGEKADATVDSMSLRRYWFESRLIKAWMQKTNKPLLGICLGCQFTNVMSGGTLIQDIPSKVGQRIVHRKQGGAEHPVRIERQSRLYSILGTDSLVVNSYHHQAVEKVGANFRVVAHAPDGVIEALEWPGKRFGVFLQWHPERMAIDHRQKIFASFIAACRQQAPGSSQESRQ